MNNVIGIHCDIMEYIKTFYDKLFLELYYTYRIEAVSVITAQSEKSSLETLGGAQATTSCNNNHSAASHRYYFYPFTNH